MNWVDFTIILIIGIFGLLSLRKGFLRELLSFLSWIFVIIAVVAFSGSVSKLLENQIQSHTIRIVIASLVIIFIVLIASKLLSIVLEKIISVSGLSGIDRMLGALLGTMKGAIIVTVIIGILVNFNIMKLSWYQNSALLPIFEELSYWSKTKIVEYVVPAIKSKYNETKI